jgi:prepilin-type N-terminal cleavage/methylation domain-containing protein
MIFMQIKYFSLNNKGFTLVEIMVTALLVAIMTLTISSVMLSNQKNFKNFQNNQVALNEISRLNYYMQKYFSQAINIRYHGNVDLDTHSTLDTDYTGRLRLYDSTSFAMVASTNSGFATNIETLALTVMENKNSALNQSDSSLATLGLFFQRPTAQTFGQLHIQKASGSSVYSGVDLSPGTTDANQTASTFERLVEAHVVRVYPEGAVAGNKITAADFRFVTRSFVDPDENTWHWCPSNITSTACPKISVNDHEELITVTFKNNLIDDSYGANVINTTTSTSGTPGTRTLGPIYFFQMNTFYKD